MPASYPLNTGMGFNSVLCVLHYLLSLQITRTQYHFHTADLISCHKWLEISEKTLMFTLLGNPPPATSTGRPHGALSPWLLCIPGCCPPHGPGKCSVLLYRHKPTWKEVSKDMFVLFASYLQKIKSIDKVLLSRTFLQHWWGTFW